jgi:hypothetical protein
MTFMGSSSHALFSNRLLLASAARGTIQDLAKSISRSLLNQFRFWFSLTQMNALEDSLFGIHPSYRLKGSRRVALVGNSPAIPASKH